MLSGELYVGELTLSETQASTISPAGNGLTKLFRSSASSTSGASQMSSLACGTITGILSWMADISSFDKVATSYAAAYGFILLSVSAISSFATARS